MVQKPLTYANINCVYPDFGEISCTIISSKEYQGSMICTFLVNHFIKWLEKVKVASFDKLNHKFSPCRWMTWNLSVEDVATMKSSKEPMWMAIGAGPKTRKTKMFASKSKRDRWWHIWRSWRFFLSIFFRWGGKFGLQWNDRWTDLLTWRLKIFLQSQQWRVLASANGPFLPYTALYSLLRINRLFRTISCCKTSGWK